jgi:hypothetical protein
MQIINKRYTITVVAILSILLIGDSSCKKILDQKPKNSTYDEVYWQSAKDAESAIAGNYALLRAALADESSYDPNAYKYYMYGDAETSSTTYFTMNYTGDGLEGIQGGDFTFQYNLQTLGDWTKFYKAIAMSNLILAKIPGIADDKLAASVEDVTEYKNKIMGQALFIRAYSYFMLTKIYGDVPLVTVSYDNVLTAPQLPRSDKMVVMKQIEDDCHQAMGMLNWGYDTKGERSVTANKSAVYALLSHLYLWRATTADLSTDTPNSTDLNSADTTLQTLTTRGDYQPQDTSTYGDLFTGQSTETIFELAMSEDNQEGAYYHIGLDFLTGTYVNGYGYSPRCWVPDNYMTTHYGYDRVGDGEGWVNWADSGWVWEPIHVKGYSYFFNRMGTYVDITSISDEKNGLAWVYHADIDDYTEDTVGGKGIDPQDIRCKNNFTTGGTQGHTCRKYRNVIYRNKSNQTNPYMSNNLILFRWTELRLLQAEVALYKGNLQGAVNIINWSMDRNNSILPRADVASGKDALMYQYMQERGREVYLEGQLYWDLIRTRQYRQFISWLSDSRFKLGGFFWPIVPTLFQDNRFLTQTLYWRGKV